MKNIDTSESQEINEQQHNENQSHWRTIFNDSGALASIAFPFLIHFIFRKHDFNASPLFKFTILLLPRSYSALQYLLLFYTNSKSSRRSKHALNAFLRGLLNILFIAFSAISLFSIIMYTLDEWVSRDPPGYSLLSPSIIVPFVYLLSSSCNLTTASFTDTGATIIIDVLILLLPIVGGTLLRGKFFYYPYIAVLSFILILSRSLKDIYFPHRDTSVHTVPWRVATFILILILTVLIYVYPAGASLDFIERQCKRLLSTQEE
uniref:Uncharacterized protein n=1 Tax=Encephalitozoon cuniculi TaxID=6035 RepID=M1KBS5_ENCCN|nr:hypothetical protein ECU01_0006 [Encephalitozoon cuniculi]